MRNVVAIIALAVAASAAGAQATVDPGMSRETVVQRLGKPASERKTGTQTYLFYANGCEKKCGMNDLVVLENDAVVDAIFRSPRRHYSGQSSSPPGVTPARTAATARASGSAAQGRGSLVIGGDQPAPANDQPTRQAGARDARSRQARARGANGGTNGIVADSSGSRTDASASGGATSGATTGSTIIPRYQAGPPAITPAPAASNPTGPVAPRAGTFNGATNDSVAARAHSPMFVSPNPGTPQVPRADSTSSPATPITPGQRPAPFVGARPNPTDSARMAQQKRQQPDSTKPPEV